VGLDRQQDRPPKPVAGWARRHLSLLQVAMLADYPDRLATNPDHRAIIHRCLRIRAQIVCSYGLRVKRAKCLTIRVTERGIAASETCYRRVAHARTAASTWSPSTASSGSKMNAARS